mgnify:FL=1
MEFSRNMDKEDIAYCNFREKYGSGYELFHLQELATNFSDSKNKKKDYVACVRSFLNLDLEERDRYKAYFKFLKENFDLTGNILEIGAGTFPTLAHYIDKEQQLKESGSIEIYDPLLVTMNLENIIANKSLFEDDKKTKDKDLLIGMAPRDATEVIVRTANKYKKPFSILMCPNIKKSSKYDEELDALLELINSTKNDSYNVGVSYLDKNCYYPYPIVYKK